VMVGERIERASQAPWFTPSENLGTDVE
jgi:hypothetical protein